MTDIDAATRTERPDAPRPRVVSVLSQKGGTGKTTLSCALAALATRAGTATAILDLDPQASAAKWHDLRRANGGGTRPSSPRRAAGCRPSSTPSGGTGPR